MPTYHLKRADGQAVTLVNIGVGPSNAKTATDPIAVLRPHAWLMVRHCAALRNSQRLVGDFVLAHAYLRENHVLDDDLPVWVPIPALAEIQIALQEAVAEVTRFEGYELKRIMRTGTVATIDNRNWELRDQSGPVHRLSLSRAIALDIESATIAANGFRFRVPYGTLLCISDKPLHGELKLPGMATEFYRTQVARHLEIGVKAMDKLREMPLERIHSRKLRSFEETAFLQSPNGQESRRRDLICPAKPSVAAQYTRRGHPRPGIKQGRLEETCNVQTDDQNSTRGGSRRGDGQRQESCERGAQRGDHRRHP